MNKFFFIICIIVFLFKTQTIFSNNLIYDVNNIEVSGKISNNLDKTILIQSAFKKAFLTFVNKTLLKKDALNLYKTKIRTIEDLVFGYQIELEANKPDRLWSGGIYDQSRRDLFLYPLSNNHKGR